MSKTICFLTFRIKSLPKPWVCLQLCFKILINQWFWKSFNFKCWKTNGCGQHVIANVWNTCVWNIFQSKCRKTYGFDKFVSRNKCDKTIGVDILNWKSFKTITFLTFGIQHCSKTICFLTFWIKKSPNTMSLFTVVFQNVDKPMLLEVF